MQDVHLPCFPALIAGAACVLDGGFVTRCACAGRYTKNLGGLLAPPCRAEHGLGSLQPTHVTVEGTSWRESSTDIAIAGVGWLGIGVQGAGAFDVWTHTGEALFLICMAEA